MILFRGYRAEKGREQGRAAELFRTQNHTRRNSLVFGFPLKYYILSYQCNPIFHCRGPGFFSIRLMADEAKARGNATFSAGNFESAVRHFSDAIAVSPTNHVLYSNRSAAYASLLRYSEALDDAKKTVELNPDWSKGYGRLGAAHLGLGHTDDAISAYTKGLEIDPNNEGLKSGLADAQAAASSRRAAPNPFGDVFHGPEMWAKLTADPSTRDFMKQPDFVRVMQDLQKNPSSLNLYLKDQRVMQALGVLLNV